MGFQLQVFGPHRLARACYVRYPIIRRLANYLNMHLRYPAAARRHVHARGFEHTCRIVHAFTCFWTLVSI
jgi:hypothetical protein